LFFAEGDMEALMQLGGYLIAVFAAAVIVTAIEALNERGASGPSRRRQPVTIGGGTRSAGLRQNRS
jgi:hypothetical protein